MKSIKLALVMAVFAVTSLVGLDRPTFVQKNGTGIQIVDPEILQIQKTLQQIGSEHLTSKQLSPTFVTEAQNKISELTQKLKGATKEQLQTIKAQIEQLRLNIQKYTSTAPAA